MGLRFSKEIKAQVQGVERISNRILTATIAGNPCIRVIATYASRETLPEEDKEKFCADLNTEVSKEKQHDMLIVMGDFNARVGQYGRITSLRVVGFHAYQEKTNSNEQKLIDFCQFCHILVLLQ